MISPTPERKSSLQIWRETVFNRVIKAVAVAGIIAYVLGLGAALGDLTARFFFSYTAAFLWIMITAFVTRIPTVVRAYNFSIILFVLGILSSIEKAAIGDGRVWLFLSVVSTVIFLGRRAGWVFSFFAVLAWGLIGYFFISSTLPQPVVAQFSFSIWSGTTLTLLIAGVITVLSIGALLQNLGETLQESLALTAKSEEQSIELEKQRRSLEERSRTLEASVKISRRLASLSNAQDIFLEATKLLQEGFSLHCAAIFVLEKNNLLRLESSLGWNEQAALAGEYVLSIDAGITGLAVRERRAYSNSDTHETLRTILPETRSFAAIPLRGRDAVTGVIVLQSTELDFFDPEKVTTLQSLTDQMAVLIENASLLQEKESALEAERRAYGEASFQSWQSLKEANEIPSYRVNSQGNLEVLPLGKTIGEDASSPLTTVIPIKSRGFVLGGIRITKKEESGKWTKEQLQLVETISEQLSVALESARLFEEAQRKAQREAIISDISAKVGASIRVDSILRTTVQELGKALDGAEVSFEITGPEKGDQSQA